MIKLGFIDFHSGKEFMEDVIWEPGEKISLHTEGEIIMSVDLSKVVYVDECCGNRFDTFEDAVASVKKNTMRYGTEYRVFKQTPVAIARFPQDFVKVENITVVDAPATAA